MTEFTDPRFRTLDQWDSETALRAIWESQIAAVAAIGPVMPELADIVEAALPRLRAGGRLVYAGAGTSIRVAVQDGTELGPTFNWPEERVVYLVAGGEAALRRGIEGAEDDRDAALAQVMHSKIGSLDVVIGLAASGRTPFTLAAIEAARARGSLTIGVSCNGGAPLLEVAEHGVLIETGAEVVAGSTRMKAGTVQKVVLNMLSTQLMVRLGHVHDGLMVDLRAQNTKLRRRAQDMVVKLAGVGEVAALQALEACSWRVKPAVLVALGLSAEQADSALESAGGILRAALERCARDGECRARASAGESARSGYPPTRP